MRVRAKVRARVRVRVRVREAYLLAHEVAHEDPMRPSVMALPVSAIRFLVSSPSLRFVILRG